MRWLFWIMLVIAMILDAVPAFLLGWVLGWTVVKACMMVIRLLGGGDGR